jgi:hypothetical protein
MYRYIATWYAVPRFFCALFAAQRRNVGLAGIS